MLRPTALKAQDVLVACKLYSLAEVVRPASCWTYMGLSDELGISLSEAYNSFERCRSAQLIVTVRDRKIVSKRYFYELLAVAVPRIFYAVRGGLEVGLPTSVHAPSLRGRFEEVPGAIPTVWPCDSSANRRDRKPEGRGPEGRGPEGRGPEGRGPEGRGPEGEDSRPYPRVADPRVADPRVAYPRVADPRVADPRVADPRVRGESISPIYPSVPEAAMRDLLLYELLSLVDVIRIGDTRSKSTAAAILEKKILGRGAQVQGDAIQGVD